MTELQNEQYIGDGVYIGLDGYQLWLYTQQGQRIALDIRSMEALIDYYRKFVQGAINNEIPQKTD